MSCTAGIAWARRTSLGLLLVAAVAAGCGDSEEPTEPTAHRGGYARVTKVTDGDTIRLGELGPVRLIGIDTPEVYGGVECFGHEASDFARRLLPVGTRVRYRVGVEERDRYGRLLAYVWLPGGRMLNRVMVLKGYAQPLTIPPNVEFADVFRAAARAARRAGLGLWRACGASA
ncbi:MAG: thermonuclease family protein [Thermoleophilaceae bacterium]